MKDERQVNVWRMSHMDDYQYVDGESFYEKMSYRDVSQRTGHPMAESWDAPVGRVVTSETRGHKVQWLKRSDAPFSDYSLRAFTSRAVNAVRPLLEPYGEFLPTLRDPDSEEILYFNATTTVTAIDFEKCVYRTLGRSARVIGIDVFSLTPAPELSLPAFHLAGEKRNEIFFGDVFVAAWLNAGLEGVKFEKIWSHTGGRER